MTGKRVFITGATGILGSWILADALRRGYEPSVLMRDATVRQARQRLELVLSLAGITDGAERIRVYLGDVSEPSFGLTHQQIDEIRGGTDLMVHCAASVSFDPQKEHDTWNTNVQGTVHVLDVLADTQIPLYHVSTAYVAGARTGVCLESELFKGQHFNNAYERSKCECELMIQGAFASGAYRGAIFRPSIIVGASKGGRIAQFLNFYGFLRLVEAATSGKIDRGGRVRFAMDPDCTKNLVPVDWCAEALWHIVEHDAASGLVYHLTHPVPVPQKDLLDWANSYLDTTTFRFEGVESIDQKGSPLERMAQFQLRHYRPYLQDEPLFDRTHTERALNGAVPFPETNADFFDTLFSYARTQEWRTIFSQQEVMAHRSPKTTAIAEVVSAVRQEVYS